MNSSVNILDHYAGLLAAVGGIALGLGMILFAPSMSERARRWAGVIILGGLLAGILVAFQILAAPKLAISLAILAAVWSLGWFLRSKAALQATLRCLENARVQGAILLLASIPAIAAWSYYLDHNLPEPLLMWDGGSTEIQPPVKPKNINALTDRGTPIPLYGYADESRAPEKPSAPAVGHILTGPADTSSDCHGWVFTGGRHWVTAESVPVILKENGYLEVAVPQAGDLVIYRDGSGRAAHTGCVQAVTPDGVVLVESKFSYGARFIHAAENQPYSTTWKYFRSTRKGHILRGIDVSLARPPST